MVFGDGLGGKLTSALDVTAHEFGHAVFSGTTKNKVVRYPSAETSALNEGLADFWGTQIEYYVKKDKGNWIMGDTLGGLTIRDIPRKLVTAVINYIQIYKISITMVIIKNHT